MSLAERALAMPTVSLRKLLTGRRSTVDGNAALSLVDYAEEVVRSGNCRRVPVGHSSTAT
jgi:hypothetical protein